MRKIFLSALAVMLIASMILSGCTDNPNVTDTESDLPSDTVPESDTTPEETEPKDTEPEETEPEETEPEETEPEDTTYKVVETYLPESVSSELKNLFEKGGASFITYTYGSCPYVIRDVFTISDCRLLSISIPVAKTLTADDDGNFTFTITEGENEWYSIKNAPHKVHTVTVNADEYELYENSTVNKWIKVDLTDYDIVLSESETIGFGNKNDTLIPAYLGQGDKNNAAQVLVEKSFPQMRGFISKMGLGGDIGTSMGTLVYDFEMERTYDSQEEYLAKQAADAEYARILAAVKEKYSGKKLSILGDSISTYAGYSNNTSHNSTIGGNAVYYQNSGAINNKGLYDQSDSYWHRLLTDLNMELCVNNSWSGSRVYDSLRMPDRATELDNDNGTPSDPSDDISPDVIIFYMGINDLHNDKTGEMGDLYAILQSKTDTRDDNAKIKEWLGTINKDAPTTFEQYYALSIMAMQEKYENAEIWCMSLNYNRDSRFDKTSLKQYNRCIIAIAEYFGCGVIDQTEGYINVSNCVRYSCDGKGLHPNPAGHALMEKFIIENFYANMEK